MTACPEAVLLDTRIFPSLSPRTAGKKGKTSNMRLDLGSPMARLAAIALAFLLVLPWQGAPAAETLPRFQVPVVCDIGSVCFIQNYFDRDSGPAFQDYTGGTLTYDGHKGVDIRVPNLAVMREGVEVVAAADGTVRNIRNNMPDINMRNIDPEKIKDREAGNAVAIQHGGGWESQYSHLKRGSVIVKPGEQVKAGQVIGKIGLSGATEFPHVHFSVRRDGIPVG